MLRSEAREHIMEQVGFGAKIEIVRRLLQCGIQLICTPEADGRQPAAVSTVKPSDRDYVTHSSSSYSRSKETGLCYWGINWKQLHRFHTEGFRNATNGFPGGVFVPTTLDVAYGRLVDAGHLCQLRLGYVLQPSGRSQIHHFPFLIYPYCTDIFGCVNQFLYGYINLCGILLILKEMMLLRIYR
jgi:hypothetical protein